MLLPSSISMNLVHVIPSHHWSNIHCEILNVSKIDVKKPTIMHISEYTITTHIVHGRCCILMLLMYGTEMPELCCVFSLFKVYL